MKMHNYFCEVTRLTSRLSTCRSKQVGAVLVKDSRILAIGYNGVPAGYTHCNEIYGETFDREHHHKWSHSNEIHAEQNVLAFCAKEGIETKNCTLYVSMSPCIHCAKLLINSGISKVIYLEEYDKDTTGINFLKNKIEVQNG